MSTLIFIHGSGCTSGAFAAQSKAFDNSHAPNLPGHGCPGNARTVTEFGDFIESYLEQHDVRDAVLCGNSLGGAIALDVGLRTNKRVRALIALGAGSRLKVAASILLGLRSEFDATIRKLAALMFAGPMPEAELTLIESMQLVGQVQTLRDFEACNAFDVTERLPQLLVPLLALTGERDAMTPPKYAQFLASRVPAGQVRIVPGAGHLAMIERPAETNDAIANFVQELN
ncbi:MAG: alpha/beta hydrolase [Candidatus Eremiobacteraeota bacterium]|nr:alpha/beta hydrolase [Candidatus Eremiobacteraeota bacterium]